jgi:hypothetical protein
MRRPDNRQIALDAFIARKADIDIMLERLKDLSDDHFGYSPEHITWAHVETIAHYAERLKQIADASLKEGEYAE